MEQEKRYGYLRHDLLVPDPAFIAGLPGEAGSLWRTCPRVPLIFTRQECWEEEEAEGLRCGLSLPVKEGGVRKRFSLRVPERMILSVQTPFETAASLCGDQSRIGLLLAQMKNLPQIRAGIYGSAALEWVSGYPYLSDDSDVDLLIEGQSVRALYDFYHRLPELEQLCQAPLDVEVRFPGGRDAKLRELFGTQHSVMVKSVHSVELEEAGALLGTLPG